jgi:hypothetical protein
VYGGTSPDGPTKTVQRGEYGTGTQATQLQRWGVAGGGTDLPEPRTNASGFAASGAMYLVGGNDGQGREPRCTGPSRQQRQHPEWKHLAQSDLPASIGGVEGAAPVVLARTRC